MSALNITYIGHATTLIESNGVRLLTDPIFSNRVMHLQRKPIPVTPTWLEAIDAVLISHLHWDHLHLPSLRRLPTETRLIVPMGSAPFFAQAGFSQVEELPVRGRTNVGTLPIEAVYAEHDGARIFSRVSADSVGYLIHGEQSVYFPGDTDLYPAMADFAERLDIALLPVWGWGPTLGSGHMDPYRAAMALRLLAPKVAIPIHWGTLYPIGFHLLDPAFIRQPPLAFADHAAQLAPEVKVKIVQPGHQISIDFNALD